MLPDLTTQKVAIPAALFLALSPGVLLTTDGSKVSFMNRKTDKMSVFFHALVFFLVYSLIAKCMGIVPPQIGRSYRVWTDESGSCIDPLGSLRPSVCAFTSPISSVLLSKKMKYLILGPASMGIFTLIGSLKARESDLADVKEISGSSAGAILALFLALGMSIDEILDTSLSLDIPSFVKIRIGSFFNKFGFVDMGPIRKKLVEICGRDPTFSQLDMKIYVSAFCMNTSETVYFSRDTHPHMKVIDAVCMSLSGKC